MRNHKEVLAISASVISLFSFGGCVNSSVSENSNNAVPVIVSPTPADPNIDPDILNQDDLTGYWTDERMQNAIPFPMPDVSYFDISPLYNVRLNVNEEIDLFNVPPLVYAALDDSLIVQFVGGVSCPPEIVSAFVRSHSDVGNPELILTLHDKGEQECTADLFTHTFKLTPTSDYHNSPVWSTTTMQELAQNAVWNLDSDPTQTFPFAVADTIVIDD